jgi:imidazolonepropionase-like amidohydrolase
MTLRVWRSEVVVALLVFVHVVVHAGGQTGLQPAESIFVRSAHWFDPVSGEMRGPAVFRVQNGQIAERLPVDRVDQSSASLVDLGTATLLPGLIDGHVHLQLGGSPEANARTILRAGFTTVVDLGATSDVVLRLRDREAAGTIEGPRILAAGLWVGTKGGVCEFGGIGVAGGPEAFRQRVRDNIATGADLIKVCVSGWASDALAKPTEYEISDDALRAVTDEATKAGRLVMAHAISRGSVQAALRTGVRGLAHAADLDAATSQQLRARGVFLVPTLASLTSGATATEVDRLRSSVMSAHAAGVPIVFGTDSGALPHGQNATEFAAMTTAGVSPVDALRSATTTAARAFALEQEIGVLEPGRIADMIAVEGNPLVDIQAMSRVVFVMHRGRIVRRPTVATPLAASLASIAKDSSGTLGVRVEIVESDAGAGVNADDWFPMMSAYKLPIAIHALQLAERGALDLSAVHTLADKDRRPGLSPLSGDIEKKGPQQRTIRDLISAVLRVSDNAASDRLLRIVGGPTAVQRMLRDGGLTGIDISRYELEFAADYYGVCCEHTRTPFSLDRFNAAIERVTPDARKRAADAFTRDRRDAAQPAAFATLLARLSQGRLLNPSHTAWVLDEMAEMHNQDGRLRAGFPPGTRVALRPGTSGETDGVRAATNDNAVVVLADGRHLVVSAFLKGASGNDAQRNATLADVARAAYGWATNSPH